MRIFSKGSMGTRLASLVLLQPQSILERCQGFTEQLCLTPCNRREPCGQHSFKDLGPRGFKRSCLLGTMAAEKLLSRQEFPLRAFSAQALNRSISCEIA